jgi:hypothetical protein
LGEACDIHNGALPIRAPARAPGATLKVGETVEYALGERRHGDLVPASGEVEVNGARESRARFATPTSRSSRVTTPVNMAWA